jgi:DNA uptake protein ComE-like DNA-binding protein
MKIRRTSWHLLAAALIGGAILAACGGAAPVAQPTVAVVAEPTAVQPTAAPVTGSDVAPTAALTAPTEAPTTATTAAEPTAAAEVAVPTMTKLNLNDVTADQLLATIPSFSNRMVREFFEYRPYISILQFRKEIGKYVDQNQVAAYEQYVYVPITVDSADAATLQQLPGVSEQIANDLIAGRPYGDNQAFLVKLGALVSASDLAAATGYLAGQ